jgi:luciferase family oxidoreductase group 1
MQLSVLEQSTLSEGSSADESITNAVKIAEHADSWGYERIWLSEHHNMNILQGSTPEVLLAAVGSRTQRIRLGSGGVMLPNHSAYRVADSFRVLEALYPGRVDCGVGRASGGDAYSTGLLNPTSDVDFPEQVDQLERYLHDEVKKALAMPTVERAPPLWLLSAASHPNSGLLAAEKGMGLAVALFINPDATTQAVKTYREKFRPSIEVPEPKVLLALNFVCAETEAKLAELKKASDFFRLMRDTGNYPSAIPSPETLGRVQFSSSHVEYLERISRREVIGTADTIKRTIEDRAAEFGADETMLAMMSYNVDDKLKAFQIVAEVFGAAK